MKANKFCPLPFFSGLFMLLALLWLTVGSSFVYIGGQQQKNTFSQLPADKDTPAETDDNTCPFDDEDDTPETYSNTWAAEYLRVEPDDLISSFISLHHHKSHYKTAFIVFHGESFSPPPDPLS